MTSLAASEIQGFITSLTRAGVNVLLMNSEAYQAV